MPTSTADASAAMVGGRVYIIGGYGVTPNDPLATNYAFDPATNSYAPRSPLPTPRWGAIAVAIDAKIYVFGGSRFNESAPDATTEAYDSQRDSWTARRLSPARIAKEGVTGCTDGVRIYLFADGIGYRYSPGADTYSILPPMPQYVSNWASCGYYKGKIYLIGGFSHDRQVERSTQIYDIKSNHWSMGRPMPFATYGSVRENPIVGHTMYIVQGQRESGEFSSAVYGYDLSRNTWSERSVGPHAADGVAGFVYQGKIFTFGGRQDLSGPYALNYASSYDPRSDHRSAWRQVTGGFELDDGELRRMVPLRGFDYSADVRAPRFSQLQTQDFQTTGDFAMEARTSEASVPGGGDGSETSGNSIAVETSPGSHPSGLAGCQLPFNSSAAAPGSTRNVAEQEAVAGSVAAGSTATTGVDEYGVARSRDSLVLTQNSRVVLRASDQSCRSGKKFVSIQTTGYGRSPWLAVFVRSYSVTEPQVEFPAMARDLVERIPAGTR